MEDDLCCKPDNAIREPIDLSAMLPNEGLIHVIDNCANDLGKAMPGYKLAVSRLKHVCRLVKRRDNQPRLLERCFGGVEGKAYHGKIKRFRGDVHTKRWGTVAFSVPEVLRVEACLRRCWDLDRFNAKGDDDEPHVDAAADPDSDDEGAYKKTNYQRCDDAIRDRYWWAYLQVLEEVARLIRKLHHFAEWCECHGTLVSELQKSDDRLLKTSLLDVWSRCPARGCRAHSLASGGVVKVLASFLHTALAHIMIEVGQELEAEQRAELMKEFELARSHLFMYFTIKLTHWTEMPWRAYAIGHPDQDIARQALRDCLRSDHPHPRVQRLHENPLLQEGRLWLDGCDLFDDQVSNLCLYVAEMYWAWTAERPVEGQHRKVKQRGYGHPNHSEHYMSYGLRRSELEDAIETPDALAKFAALVLSVKTSFDACRQLGLIHHARAQQIK